jgi:hypothetical protein
VVVEEEETTPTTTTTATPAATTTIPDCGSATNTLTTFESREYGEQQW